MKPSVVIFGDDPAGPTGFGKITAHLVGAATAAGVRPVVVGLKADPDRPWNRCPRYCVPVDTDPDGRQTAEKAMDAESADRLVSVGDPWHLQGLVDLRRRRAFSWIGCTPVDSTPYPRYILLTQAPQQYLDTAYVMGHMDRIVTFSRFGRKAVADMLLGALAAPGARGSLPPMDTVYLGVDAEKYCPAKSGFPRGVFGNAVTPDTVLFTCVKVNSMRAGFDTLLSAWAEYLDLAAKAEPNLPGRSRLYLHTNITGSGYPVPILMQRHGIEESLLLNPDLAPGKGVPESDMVRIYQATDIAVSAARAEGFGLNILEAMSCAVPCVAPDYGAPAEYGGAGVLRIPIAATYNPEFATTDFAIVDPKAMARQMCALAVDSERRRKTGEKGRARARALSWERFEDAWRKIIAETGVRNSPRIRGGKI